MGIVYIKLCLHMFKSHAETIVFYEMVNMSLNDQKYDDFDYQARNKCQTVAGSCLCFLWRGLFIVFPHI